MRRNAALIMLVLLIAFYSETSGAQNTSATPAVPVKGMVTMVDVGADRCIPCKMMAPILKEVEEEYKGKAAIAFIDVWKFPEQAEKFRVRVIPTQVFYDKNGKEVFRHEGFMDKKGIVKQLEELGVKK